MWPFKKKVKEKESNKPRLARKYITRELDPVNVGKTNIKITTVDGTVYNVEVIGSLHNECRMVRHVLIKQYRCASNRMEYIIQEDDYCDGIDTTSIRRYKYTQIEKSFDTAKLMVSKINTENLLAVNPPQSTLFIKASDIKTILIEDEREHMVPNSVTESEAYLEE